MLYLLKVYVLFAFATLLPLFVVYLALILLWCAYLAAVRFRRVVNARLARLESARPVTGVVDPHAPANQFARSLHMRTDEMVSELGLYRSKCCSEELIFDVGDDFGRCPKCQSLCDWQLEDELISHEELNALFRRRPFSTGV